MSYVKVVNKTDVPLLLTWNKWLLTPEDLAKFEAFKNSEDYLGTTPEDIAARKKVAESIKTAPFFDSLQKGVRHFHYEKKDDNRMQLNTEYKWCLGPNYELMTERMNESATYTSHLRKVLSDNKFVPVSKTDAEKMSYVRELNAMTIDQIKEEAKKLGIKIQGKDIGEVQGLDKSTIANYIISQSEGKELIKQIKNIFGTHNVVMTEEQYTNSGLANLAVRQIIQTLKPGETVPKILMEGIVERIDISDTEAMFLLEGIGGEEEIAAVEQEPKEVVSNNIDNMTFPELRELAKEKGINSFGKTKTELVRLLTDAN